MLPFTTIGVPRCPRWRWRWRGSRCRLPRRPVEPVNLVGSARSRYAGQLSCPRWANTEAATWVLPRSPLVGLHCPVGPTPLTITSKIHSRLDGDPVRPGTENGWHREGDRVGAAAYRERLASGRIDLRARKTPAIGIKEDIEIVGNARPAAIKRNAIGVDRFHIPSLTSGNDEVVCQHGRQRDRTPLRSPATRWRLQRRCRIDRITPPAELSALAESAVCALHQRHWLFEETPTYAAGSEHRERHREEAAASQR